MSLHACSKTHKTTGYGELTLSIAPNKLESPVKVTIQWTKSYKGLPDELFWTDLTFVDESFALKKGISGEGITYASLMVFNEAIKEKIIVKPYMHYVRVRYDTPLQGKIKITIKGKNQWILAIKRFFGWLIPSNTQRITSGKAY